jgi:hypothetical protein
MTLNLTAFGGQEEVVDLELALHLTTRPASINYNNCLVAPPCWPQNFTRRRQFVLPIQDSSSHLHIVEPSIIS